MAWAPTASYLHDGGEGVCVHGEIVHGLVGVLGGHLRVQLLHALLRACVRVHVCRLENMEFARGGRSQDTKEFKSYWGSVARHEPAPDILAAFPLPREACTRVKPWLPPPVHPISPRKPPPPTSPSPPPASSHPQVFWVIFLDAQAPLRGGPQGGVHQRAVRVGVAEEMRGRRSSGRGKQEAAHEGKEVLAGMSRPPGTCVRSGLGKYGSHLRPCRYVYAHTIPARRLPCNYVCFYDILTCALSSSPVPYQGQPPLHALNLRQ